jgi:hypothetical protein
MAASIFVNTLLALALITFMNAFGVLQCTHQTQERQNEMCCNLSTSGRRLKENYA